MSIKKTKEVENKEEEEMEGKKKKKTNKKKTEVLEEGGGGWGGGGDVDDTHIVVLRIERLRYELTLTSLCLESNDLDMN